MPQKNPVLLKIDAVVEAYRRQLIEFRGEAGRVLLSLYRDHVLNTRDDDTASCWDTFEKWCSQYPELEGLLHRAITGAGRDPASRFLDLGNALIELVAVFAIRRRPATKRWIGPDHTEAIKRGIESEDDSGYLMAVPASPPTIFDHFGQIGLGHEDLLKMDGHDWAEAQMRDLIRSDPDNSLRTWMHEAALLTGVPWTDPGALDSLVEKWMKKLEGLIRRQAQEGRAHFVEHYPQQSPAPVIDMKLVRRPAPKARSGRVKSGEPMRAKKVRDEERLSLLERERVSAKIDKKQNITREEVETYWRVVSKTVQRWIDNKHLNLTSGGMIAGESALQWRDEHPPKRWQKRI